MNPKQWQQFQLPKFATPKTTTTTTGSKSRTTPPVGEASSSGTVENPSTGDDLPPTGSGDLGETPLAHLEEPSTAASVHQRQNKHDPRDPSRAAAESDLNEGLPPADEVMAGVPGTQTERERQQGQEKKRESFMGVEWAKMNIFANISGGRDRANAASKAGSEQGKGPDAEVIEAQVPGVLDDLTEDERRNLEVEDGVAMESSTASLNSKNGDKAAAPVDSVSQRKDLEAKIIREMVRDLGNGMSSPRGRMVRHAHCAPLLRRILLFVRDGSLAYAATQAKTTFRANTVDGALADLVKEGTPRTCAQPRLGGEYSSA